jgi:hypothetical protein
VPDCYYLVIELVVWAVPGPFVMLLPLAVALHTHLPSTCRALLHVPVLYAIAQRRVACCILPHAYACRHRCWFSRCTLPLCVLYTRLLPICLTFCHAVPYAPHTAATLLCRYYLLPVPLRFPCACCLARFGGLYPFPTHPTPHTPTCHPPFPTPA